MHPHQNQLIVQAQYPDDAARIVRNIADIERDSQLAWGLLSDRFMTEATAAMAKIVTDRWAVIDHGGETVLVPPEWKQLRGVGHGDDWLQLSDICADDENVFCWIAAAVGVGPVQLGLELCFRRGLVEHAQAAIADDKAVVALLKRGFGRDSEKLRLFLPIAIPAVLLAKAFQENDFGAAMAPIGKAVEQALEAKAELNALVDQVRGLTKRG